MLIKQIANNDVRKDSPIQDILIWEYLFLDGKHPANWLYFPTCAGSEVLLFQIAKYSRKFDFEMDDNVTTDPLATFVSPGISRVTLRGYFDNIFKA